LPMMQKKEADISLLSEAAQHRDNFYEVSPDDRASDILCSAALELYQEGYRSLEDLVTMLIGTYAGLTSTRVGISLSVR
jgi:hypothetical protein